MSNRYYAVRNYAKQNVTMRARMQGLFKRSFTHTLKDRVSR